jgi:hypothetical protein
MASPTWLGQACAYWNKGPGPGPSSTETDEGHEWSASTGEAAAANLVAVARALQADPSGRRRVPSGLPGQATQVVSQGRHHHSFLRLVSVPSLSGL